MEDTQQNETRADVEHPDPLDSIDPLESMKEMFIEVAGAIGGRNREHAIAHVAARLYALTSDVKNAVKLAREILAEVERTEA